MSGNLLGGERHEARCPMSERSGPFMYFGAAGVGQGYPGLPGPGPEEGCVVKYDQVNRLLPLGIYPNHGAPLTPFIEHVLPHGDVSHGGPSVGCGYGCAIGQASTGPCFRGRRGVGCFPCEIQRSGPFEPEGQCLFRHKYYSLLRIKLGLSGGFRQVGMPQGPEAFPRAVGSRKRGRQAPRGRPRLRGRFQGWQLLEQSIRDLRPDRFPGGEVRAAAFRGLRTRSEAVIFHPGGYWGVRTGSLVSFR